MNDAFPALRLFYQGRQIVRENDAWVRPMMIWQVGGGGGELRAPGGCQHRPCRVLPPVLWGTGQRLRVACDHHSSSARKPRSEYSSCHHHHGLPMKGGVVRLGRVHPSLHKRKGLLHRHSILRKDRWLLLMLLQPRPRRCRWGVTGGERSHWLPLVQNVQGGAAPVAMKILRHWAPVWKSAFLHKKPLRGPNVCGRHNCLDAKSTPFHFFT